MDKKCSSCGQIKAIELFSFNKNTKDGHTSNCKECAKAISKAYNKDHNEEVTAKKRKSWFENRADILKKQKVFYKNNKEKILARDKIYYEKNREKILIRARDYVRDNIQKYVNYTKEYRIKNPEKAKAHSAVNTAIQDGKMPSAKFYKCTYCERQACDYHHHKGYEKEHRLDVIPVCRYCHKHIEK